MNGLVMGGSGRAMAQAPRKNFDHLAGRGMHELRFDELPDYVMSIAGDELHLRAAVQWIVGELERKTNDERAIAVQLSNLRETLAASTHHVSEAAEEAGKRVGYDSPFGLEERN